MMKMKYALLVVSVMAAGTASAQSSKFQGAFGQIGVGYENVKPSAGSSTLSVNRFNIPINTSITSTNSAVGTIGIGWYQDVAKGFLLGVGAEYSPFAGSGGTTTVSTARALPGQNLIVNDYSYQKKDSYNLYLSPAVLVGTDGMAYAKVGFTGAKVLAFESLNYNFTGYSLGLGYRHIFKGGLYGFVEANYADYGSETKTESSFFSGTSFTASNTKSLTSYNVLVGVGYKF
jgi:outer membrane immunogenic protein